MNPRATKKAATINHTVLLAKPERDWAILRVPVREVIMTPIITTAPMGKGVRMSPKMVATKMAKRCQASFFTPAGIGINQIINPTAITISPLINLAPTVRSWPFIAFSFLAFFDYKILPASGYHN
jgi:hypothetical protein